MIRIGRDGVIEPFVYVPTWCRACGSSANYYDPNPKGLPPADPERPTCLMGSVLTGEPGATRCGSCHSTDVEELAPISWCVVGGESGPGARPCDVAWVRSVVEQCRAANTPCFVKQLGAKPFEDGALVAACLRDRKGGDPAEWPADLRVREFPKARTA